MFSRNRKSAREEGLLAFARKYLPSGVRTPSGSPDQAMAIMEGRGSRIRDFSGNEYIDYLLGSGPMLLGHAHPAVVSAVRAQLDRGSSFLMVNEPAVLLAEEIVKAVPCADRVCFNSSGSESTLFAMRMARAHRRRDKILKFEGGFHGMSDYALMSNQWTRAIGHYPSPVPVSAGIPGAIEGEVLVAPYNDLETTTAIIESHHEDLAGVIVEPMQRTIPPAPGFLEGLREVTEQYGIVLIFDEVVTGFRLAYGGAQQFYGVTPDLCALGKSISGGHPISVLCGRDEIMSLADPSRYGSGSYVMQTGTFSGNPVSCSAALATIKQLKEDQVYDRLFATGRTLMDTLQQTLDGAGVSARVVGEAPVFEVWFTDHEVTDFRAMLTADAERHDRFTKLLLDHGIVKAHEKFFVSTAHTDEDVKLTTEAFEAAAAELAG